MKKTLPIFLLLLILSGACKDDKVLNNGMLTKEILAATTAVASVGLCEKVDYKFIEPLTEKGRGSIQLRLYNCRHDSINNQMQAIAQKSAKTFVDKFVVEKKYQSILVSIIETPRGDFNKISKINSFSFLVNSL